MKYLHRIISAVVCRHLAKGAVRECCGSANLLSSRKRRAVRGKFSCKDDLWRMRKKQFQFGLRGLDPRIHVFISAGPVDGRVEPGQDEIGKAISLLWSPQDFPRTALRESGDPGTSDSNPWVPAFAGTTDMRMRAPDFVIGLQPRGLGSIPAMDTSFRRCDEEGRRRPIFICYSPGFLESGGMKALSAALRLLSASIRKLALTTTRSPPPSPWRTS